MPQDDVEMMLTDRVLQGNESLRILDTETQTLQTSRRESREERTTIGLDKFEQLRRGQTSDGKAGKDNVEDECQFDEDAIKDLLESSVVAEDQLTEENQYIQSPNELSVEQLL